MKLFCVASSVPADVRRGFIPARNSLSELGAGSVAWLQTMEPQCPMIIAPDVCPLTQQFFPEQNIRVVPELSDRDHGEWHDRNLRNLSPTALEDWLNDPQFAPPSGESACAVFHRIGGWLGSLANNVNYRVIIARPAVVRMLLIHGLGGGVEMVGRLDVPPSSRSDMSYHMGWRVSRIGVPLG